ncbi:MAG: hypothetical protein AAB571_04960 [Chloroflexota bacterium]
MTTLSEPQRTRPATPNTTPQRPIPTRQAPKRGLNISTTQIIVVVLIIIGLSVIIDFNRKIQGGQKITGEANQMRAEVTALAATKAALATELAYVSSDAYVASWAHNDGRYVQANEVLVVPVPAKNTTAVPPTPVRVIQKPPSNFEIWWALFFESGES